MFNIINDERLVSKMERKNNCSRRLKQFNGLTRVTLTSVTRHILRQIYATDDYDDDDDDDDSE